jgi:hypothetical protein
MLHWANLIIDWFSLPSLALLAWILLSRGWRKEFPLFFLYVIATQFVGFTRLLTFGASANLYRTVYFVSDIVLAVFAFLATYELFIKRLFPRSHKISLFRYLFPTAAIVIAVLAVASALYGNHKAVLVITARVYEVCRTAVLVFFVALMTLMGRQWSKQEFGIASGFGLDVSTSLAVLAFWSRDSRPDPIIGKIPVIAYDLACIIWIFSFWKPRNTPSTSSADTRADAETLHEARKWEQVLKDLLTPGKRMPR